MLALRNPITRGSSGRRFRLVAALASLVTVLAAQQPYVVGSLPPPGGVRRPIGAAVAPAGDVDLDGKPDLLVGFPASSPDLNDPINDQMAGAFTAGESGFHVWSPLTGTIIRTVVEPGYAIRGYALANLGDVDGDGKPDHAVSHPRFTPPPGGGNWVGRVDAYSGATGSVLWSFVSTTPGSQAGASLARIADVNLDGKPDLLVGAIGMSGLAGRAFVLSGQTGAVLRTHVGAIGDTLGWAVSDAGDVDGDGTSDYAAGAPQTAVLGGTQPAGYVQIWSGATGALIRTVNGVANFDRFGRALAPAGDLNGDGVPDLYVGSPARFGLAMPGRVYGISGSNGAVILTATRNVGGDRFGWALAAAGDRNGDGKVDVAVGTTVGVVEVRSGAFGGVLHVQSGFPAQPATNGLIMRPFPIGDLDGDGVIDVAVGSPNSGDNGLLIVFPSLAPAVALAGDDGHADIGIVAALGDLDGDGIRDLAISNPEANSAGLVDCGKVSIWSSAQGAAVAELSGTSSNAWFGFSVSTLDDVNGDGLEEFLVASPVGSGFVTCHSGATGAVLYTATGPIAGGAFGYSLRRLSDLNGDGIREFAAGAPYSNVGGLPTTGQLHVCNGANGAILVTVSGLAQGEFFGTPVDEIGDVDGDAVPDLVVGAAYASIGGIPFSGVARVISGATGAILRTHAGTVSGAATGGGVCGAGLVDGDLVPDYAVASPATTASGPGPAGPVVVYSGATGAVIRTLGPTPIPPGYSVSDSFGVGLSNGGDLDGDGTPDLLLGVHPFVIPPPASVQPREIHAYSGATGVLITRQTATASFDPWVPSKAASGFDLTGDGTPDWVALPYPSPLVPTPSLIMSRAGLPAGTTSVGSGCHVAGGAAPVLQTGGGALVAAVGAPQFELILSRAAAFQTGALAIGASNTSWNGQPLPLDLTAFGLAGCFLHNSVDSLSPFTTTVDGLYGFPAPLPALPSLAGTTAHAQGFLLGPVGTVVAATNGLTVVVQ
jgi:FG-GAP repeat